MEKMMITKPFRLILVALTASVFLLAAGCGGGGGSGGCDGDDGFPTPRLPADAAKFDVDNTDEIAEAAVGFVGTLDTLAELKTETSPSIPQVARLVTDRIMRRTRNSDSVAARTEDISAGLCNSGTATAEFEESGNNESGSVTFTGCDLDGSGEIVINGSFSYVASSDGATLDYSFQVGGSLTMAVSSESITIVMNLTESGNDGTGAISSNVSYSLSGIPGGGFLVTTAQPWVGNVLNPLAPVVTDGQLIVHGGDNTLIRITVTTINEAAVDLDEGSGFMPHSTFLIEP
jgi:hypothetical protein